MSENTLQALERCARKIFDASGGKLSAEVGVDVKIHPGNLVTVQYVARYGEYNGPNGLELGESPDAATDNAVKYLEARLKLNTIEREKLEAQAEKLGLKLVEKGAQ